MDKKTQMYIVGALVVIIALAAVVTISMAHSNDEKWEELATDAIEDEGYHGITLTSCSHAITDDSAMIIGSFTCNGSYYSYSIDCVKENGTWKAYRTDIF